MQRILKYLNFYKCQFKGSHFIKEWAYRKILNIGCDIPPTVQIGKNLGLPHPFAIVCHPQTVIGNNVRIYQGVTIGRGDIYKNNPDEDFKGFKISDGAIICAGAKIINSHGLLVIGENSIVGANAVVTSSVPANVVVGGMPAKIIRTRNEK